MGQLVQFGGYLWRFGKDDRGYPALIKAGKIKTDPGQMSLFDPQPQTKVDDQGRTWERNADTHRMRLQGADNNKPQGVAGLPVLEDDKPSTPNVDNEIAQMVRFTKMQGLHYSKHSEIMDAKDWRSHLTNYVNFLDNAIESIKAEESVEDDPDNQKFVDLLNEYINEADSEDSIEELMDWLESEFEDAHEELDEGED